MFGRNGGAKTAVAERVGTVTEAVTDAADAGVGYVDPLAKDEKLRQRLAAAVLAGAAARRQIRRQTGLTGLARRLGADPVVRAQLIEVGSQLQAAQKRAKKPRSHKLRNTVLFVSGVGMVVAAVPAARERVLSLVRRPRDISVPGWAGASSPEQTAIEEAVEVAVPVSTAYNQWTQFEEFPRFMEGVDEVRQLDDTLLHWAATVAGKRAEWDAKIIEQVPHRRIVWESVDGKQTRGTVSFEPAGSAGRTRVRLAMSY